MRRGWPRAAAGVAAVAGWAPFLTACGGGPTTPLSAPQILRFDTGSRTVQITARAAYGSFNQEMNFDGYGNGALTITVPFGWLISVQCVNESQLLRHSCAVVSDTPASLGYRPLAFPEASSPDPSAGSVPGASSTFEFVADRPGSYRLACLVHGHEIDGMWDRLVVENGVRPSVTVRR